MLYWKITARPFFITLMGKCGNAGYYTLVRKQKSLPEFCSARIQQVKEYIVRFADSLMANSKTNAFRTVMVDR